MPSRPPAARQTPAGAREAAKHETREALVAAALEAFAEQGFDAPSLDAVCARAGLTRGAFYVHFADRDALVVAVVTRVIARFLDAVIAGDEPAGLDATIGRFVDAVDVAQAGARARRHRDPLVLAGLLPLHRILEAASRSPAIRSRLIEIAHEARDRVAAAARAGQRAGRVRRDVEPEQLAAVLVATALGALLGAEVGVPLDLRALQATILRMVVAPARR